jgi:hypothetical protein
MSSRGLSSPTAFAPAATPAAADEPEQRLPLVHTVTIACTASVALWISIAMTLRWMLG